MPSDEPENRPVERFGDLATDEALQRKARRSEFENAMLMGCVSFSLASVAIFSCFFVPFALAAPLYTYADLYKLSTVSAVLAALFGIGASIFGGPAGFCGSIAGLIPSALFLWLRLRDAATGLPGIEGFEPAEFPISYSVSVPVFVCVALAGFWGAAYWARSKYFPQK